MAKVKSKPVDFSDPRKCWEEILRTIGTEGKEYPLWSAIRRKREIKYIKVYTDNNKIIVDKAQSHPSANISKPRTITYDQFLCVTVYYKKYVEGVTNIRELIRDKCGMNSSYIISLIHHICS